MDVHDVVSADQLPYETLSLLRVGICGNDGYLRVAPVALPVDAYRFEAGVGSGGGEPCVPATYFDGARAFTSAFYFLLESNDLVVWFFIDG